MIQRLQSLYLLAITVISCLLLFSDIPFYSETGKPSIASEKPDETTEFEAVTITVDYNSTDTETEKIGTNHTTVYFLGGIALLSVIAIFMFKKRTLQQKLVFGIIVMNVVVVVSMYLLSFGTNYTDIDTKQSILNGAGIPLAIFAFAILAYQRIGKDEKLVRSLDRIR